MKGLNYVEIPLRSNAILIFQNIDKYCFNWSTIASLHFCNLNHPNKVSKHKHYFDELNLEGFDFTNGLKGTDVHKFNELKKLSIHIFELYFYQDQNNAKHKLIPI